MLLTLTHDGYYVTGGSGSDFRLTRTDLAGTPIWQRAYGGSAAEYLTYEFLVDQTGILLGGYSYSYGSGGADYWIVRTDLNGAPLWTRSLGGPGNDLSLRSDANLGRRLRPAGSFHQFRRGRL